MVIDSLHNIVKKERHIAYRRIYTGEALIHFKYRAPQNIKLEFSLEMTPLGKHMIKVELLDEVDYPLLPILKKLEEEVRSLHDTGALP